MEPTVEPASDAPFKSDVFVTVISRRRATIIAVRIIATAGTVGMGLVALHQHSWIPLLVAVAGSALVAPLVSMWSLHRAANLTGMPPHQQMMLWERYVRDPKAIEREIDEMREIETPR